MKVILSIIIFCLPVLAVNSQSTTDEIEKNIVLTFDGCENWDKLLLDDSSLICLRNKNRNMEVRLYETSERIELNPKNALKYFVKKSGFILLKNPFKVNICERKALAVIAVGQTKTHCYRMLLFMFEKDQTNYMISIKCPEECYAQHQGNISEFLSTLSVMP